MLVCNVSLLTRRGVIAAGITEAASAQDRPGTGNVVFATLVDDPAAVLDRVDAYFGQIIVEATNATANANAGLIVASTVVESASAAALSSAAVVGTVAGAMAESASAIDMVDSSKIAGARFEGVLALNGPIMPAASQPAVILIDG